MRFTYVHSGWEGSANDSQVMQDTLGHAEYEFPWPPRSKKKNLVHLVLELFFGIEICWVFLVSNLVKKFSGF